MCNLNVRVNIVIGEFKVTPLTGNKRRDLIRLLNQLLNVTSRVAAVLYRDVASS